MPSRRAFLAGLVSASSAPCASWASLGNPTALSAAKDAQGRYLLVGLRGNGEITFRVPLPTRGHAAAAHPRLAEAVAIARRPGIFAKVINCVTGHVTQELRCPEGRHFYGHAAFSKNGDLLFTPENEVSTGAGCVGIWERAAGYRRMGSVSSGGVGPHEIIRLQSGAMAVANGGIRTHPQSGREKLNLGEMRPNLTLLDPSGQILDQIAPPPELHLNSLRHIAESPDGSIICGFQWQGDPYEAPPLVGFYNPLTGLSFSEVADTIWRGLNGYVGSVCAYGTGAFAASAPRGGRALVFDSKKQHIGTHRMTDVCGLCPSGVDTCLVTDGLGQTYTLGPDGLQKLHQHRLAFDNHLVRLTGA